MRGHPGQAASVLLQRTASVQSDEIGHHPFTGTYIFLKCFERRYTEIRARCVSSKFEPLKRTLTHATRPIVQLREDRQRDIAVENYSLMHRLAGIMKEDRVNLAQRFSHLSVEYRESMRRKKELKLQVGMKAIRSASISPQ